MKLHVTLLSAAIASAIFASPLWADDDKKGDKPEITTTSAPMTGTRPTNDMRPSEQKARETEKDKDDAKAIPKTKPAAAPTVLGSDKTIHYKGDPIELRTVVPKSLKDVWEGKATVKIVITMPGGDLAPVVLDVPTPAADQNTQGDKPRRLAGLTAEQAATLPAGDYQMAMIITKNGGDPLNVADWYGGFKGLMGVKRLKIAATTTADPEDPSKTGNVTGDTDGDGYPDSDPNMPPPPAGDNTQQCLLPEGCTKPAAPTTGGTTPPPPPPTGGATQPPAGATPEK